MKFVIILSIVAVTLAKDFEMKLEENGEKFTEKVKVDIAGKTEEIEVPKHGNRAAIILLNDFNVGYSARKVMVEKACYISAMGREENPAQMERNMEKSHAQFPTDSYMVSKDKFIRLYNMTASEVGPKIAAHCAGYDMIFTMNFKKDSDVLKIVKSLSTRNKRSGSGITLVRQFTGCDIFATNVLEGCPINRIKVNCKFTASGWNTCVYRIICSQNTVTRGTWKCIGEHKVDLPFCCDYTCKN